MFGVIAGIIAAVLDEKPFSKGFFGPVFVGVLGSFAGGVLASLFFGVSMNSLDLRIFSLVILGTFSILVFRKIIHNL